MTFQSDLEPLNVLKCAREGQLCVPENNYDCGAEKVHVRVVALRLSISKKMKNHSTLPDLCRSNKSP